MHDAVPEGGTGRFGPLALLRARRFGPLFTTQFLSAFNDNFVRQTLAMLILFWRH